MVKPYVLSMSLAAVLLIPAAIGPSLAAAQGITQEQATAILDELKQIRLLLERGPRQDPSQAAAPAVPDQRVTLPVAAGYELGRADAPLTLVEFTDYECPFCRQFHISTFEQLKKNYIDTGKLRYVSRDLPLEFHKHALGAAHAARCAGEQGKYWEMRHVMIVNANMLNPDALLTYARDIGLDMPGFQGCLKAEKHGAAIKKDIADAQAAGVSATPTFILGKASKQGLEGIKIVGALPYGSFEAKIRELLGE